MKSPLFCPACGTEFGFTIYHSMTPTGQDPPETIYDDEESVAFDKNYVAYCGVRCRNRATGTEEEPPE